MADRIIITGGNGQVGKSLQPLLNGLYLSRQNLDLLNAAAVDNLFSDVRPTIVIHLAARVSGIKGNSEHPYNHAYENVTMDANVINACINHRVERFITLLSTCAYPERLAIYRDGTGKATYSLPKDTMPYMESDLLVDKPHSSNLPYGYAKRMTAVMIDAANKQFGLKYQYLIPCNIYGIHDRFNDTDSHFIGAVVYKIEQAIAKGENHIKLMGTGAARRQFINSNDVARVIFLCLERNITDCFNLVPDYEYGIDQIASMALSTSMASRPDGYLLEILFDGDKTNDGQIFKTTSGERFLKLFPDFKYTGLKEGLQQIWKHRRSN